MSRSIPDGGLTVKDPANIEVWTMDWDTKHLGDAVTISSSTWAVTGPDALLTTDSASILAGSRKTQVRLSAGTLGAVYTVTNTIVTNETPTQTKDRSFLVLVQQE